MAAPRSFAKKMRAFAKDIPVQSNEIKKALAIESLTQVHGDTPVDTGQARDGWNTTLGAPDTTTVPTGPYGPSVHRGQENRGFPTRGGTGAINKGYKAISKAKPGVDIYLTNNLPYIGKLNDGYSKQAPRNFFAIAIKRARGIMKRQVIRYRGY